MIVPLPQTAGIVHRSHWANIRTYEVVCPACGTRIVEFSETAANTTFSAHIHTALEAA